MTVSSRMEDKWEFAVRLVCLGVTCVSLMQVALQATQVSSFKGTELALKGLVVTVVGLHVPVQAVDTKHKKIKDLAILGRIHITCCLSCRSFRVRSGKR